MENIIRIDDNVAEVEVNNADILPANLTKIIAKFDIIRNKISEQKNSLDEVNKEIKTFEKLIHIEELTLLVIFVGL